MPGIVCAIRGGPASQPTINKSINLAIENNLPLHFLYVVNLEFLSHSPSSRVQLISKEMQQMGEFILLSACSEAHKQGVEAEGIVRQGSIWNEILKLCREIEADFLVMGSPKEGEESLATQEQINKFRSRIEDSTQTKVILVRRENNEG